MRHARILAMLLPVLGICTMPASAGVYKYVDADGKVVFTDRPPPEQTGAEAVDLPQDGSVLKPRLHGSTAYCGSLRLGDIQRPDLVLASLPHRREQVKHELRGLRIDYERAMEAHRGLGAYSDPDIADMRKRLLELDCAVHWFEQQSARRLELERETALQAERLSDRIRQQMNHRDKTCGPPPEQLGHEPPPSYAATRATCLRGFEPVITQLEALRQQLFERTTRED